MDSAACSNSPFCASLKQMCNCIHQSRFEDCIILAGASHQFSEQENIEIQSLLCYALTMTKQYSQAMGILNSILEKQPLHLSSKKRRAVLLEKMGRIEESKAEFEFCLLLEPESRSLRNKLKRLSMCTNNSEGFSSDSKESSNLQEKEETEKSPSLVKFGNFEIIEFNTEDSDEHFALIKDEISKLSEKKPKKSILKESMSASVFKEKKNSEPKLEEPSSAKFDPEADSFKAGKEEMLGEKKKKKCKSVSFKGDTQMEDVQ